MDSMTTKFLSSSRNIIPSFDKCGKKSEVKWLAKDLGHRYLRLIWGRSFHLDVKLGYLELLTSIKYVLFFFKDLTIKAKII